MRIIIDGNDGVGKTTLSLRLKEDLDIKSYVHLSYKDPTNFLFYSSILEKTDIIFDRSFIDEPIYSEVLRRKPGFNNRSEENLYEKLKKLNYIVIICYSPKKINKDNEHKEIIENEKLIDRYFENVAKKNNFVYYDPINDDYDKLLEGIEKLNAKL